VATRTCIGTSVQHLKEVRAVAISSDCTLFASGSKDGALKVWTIGGSTRWPAAECKGHRGSIRTIAFQPSRPFLASASEDCTARIWNQHTGDQIYLLRVSDESGMYLTSLAWSPCGRILATAGYDTIVRLWAVAMVEGEDPYCVREEKAHECNIYSTGFSADGALLATSAEDGAVKLWDVHGLVDGSTEVCCATLSSGGSRVRSIAFRGKDHIVTVSEDSLLREWSIPRKGRNGSATSPSKYNIPARKSGALGATECNYEALKLPAKQPSPQKTTQQHPVLPGDGSTPLRAAQPSERTVPARKSQARYDAIKLSDFSMKEKAEIGSFRDVRRKALDEKEEKRRRHLDHFNQKLGDIGKKSQIRRHNEAGPSADVIQESHVACNNTPEHTLAEEGSTPKATEKEKLLTEQTPKKRSCRCVIS